MLVQMENVHFAYSGTPILSEVSFELHENERVGLIGANGEGKTTLIKLMLGMLTPDTGNILRKNGITFGYLEQSGGFASSSTVYGAMEEVFARDKELILRLQETQKAMAQASADDLRILSARNESLIKQIDARDSYHYDVRIKTILNGMGFESFYDRVVDTMSGGEKTKLKLCRLLLEQPDLLILDEPTNHLDVKTLFWLEDYLSNYKGALFVVSHDRYFLDKLTTRTLEIEYGKLESYKGNYTKYRALKKERYETRQKEYEKQQEEIAHLEDYVARNLVRATTAKSAQSRVKQLEKMERLKAPPAPPKPPRFAFSYDEKPYERVIFADNFDLEIGGKRLLSNTTFSLMRGKKCALIGDNGTGKSTLLKYLLSGTDKVKFGRFVSVGYYDQENADLDPDERVLEAFWGKFRLLTQTDARKILASAGLSADDVFKTVKELSGGLRAKLELAILTAKHANTLILDEPTNHLDLPSRESLEESLSAFDGTLLFVSHDRRFIEAIANEIVELENGALHIFEGTYKEFLAQKQSPVQIKRNAEQTSPKNTQNFYRSKDDRARDAKKKERIKQIETRLEQLESEETQASEELAEYAADYERVKKITARLENIRNESDTLYAEYETLI